MLFLFVPTLRLIINYSSRNFAYLNPFLRTHLMHPKEEYGDVHLLMLEDNPTLSIDIFHAQNLI